MMHYYNCNIQIKNTKINGSAGSKEMKQSINAEPYCT